MPGVSGVTVVTNARVFLHHARLRAHRAPGIPCALDSLGRKFHAQPGRYPRRGIAKVWLRTRDFLTSPRLRGEVASILRAGEGALDGHRLAESPPHPETSLRFVSDLSPQAGRGEETTPLFEIRIGKSVGGIAACVVPANAGTHNHRYRLEQKSLATYQKREAAAYGSLRSQGRRRGIGYALPASTRR